MKIITLTLNPAIDRTTYIQNNFVAGGLNKAIKSTVSAGGKGINVSRMLAKVGVPTKALGFSGGSGGELLKSLLDKEKTEYDFTEIKSETRMNVKIISESGECSELNEKGGFVSAEEYENLTASLMKEAEKSKPYPIILMCGSIPQGVDKCVYNNITDMLKTKLGGDFFAVADTSGELLKNALEASPKLIKPNSDELSELVGRKISTPLEAVENSVEIYKKYGTAVLCTVGGKGSAYVGSEGSFICSAPKVTVRGFAGAGDSFLAVFVNEHIVKGSDIPTAMIKAASAAAAVVETDGTEFPDCSEFAKYEGMIKAERVM